MATELLLTRGNHLVETGSRWNLKSCEIGKWECEVHISNSTFFVYQVFLMWVPWLLRAALHLLLKLTGTTLPHFLQLKVVKKMRMVSWLLKNQILLLVELYNQLKFSHIAESIIASVCFFFAMAATAIYFFSSTDALMLHDLCVLNISLPFIVLFYRVILYLSLLSKTFLNPCLR